MVSRGMGGRRVAAWTITGITGIGNGIDDELIGAGVEDGFVQGKSLWEMVYVERISMYVMETEPCMGKRKRTTS